MNTKFIIGRSKGFTLQLNSEFVTNNSYRYHDENTREEDLIHPEDIAHFAKHDADEDEAERVAQLDKLSIVDQNIPEKFRRN